MKKLILSVLIASMTVAPAMAMSAKTVYTLYRPVYWTVEVLTFLIAGPAIVITSLNQRFNDTLKEAVDEGQ